MPPLAALVVERDSLDACEATLWNELVAQSPDSTVFQSYEWILAWWATFRGEHWTLRLLLAYRGDRLIGLAPFYERPVTGVSSARSVHLVGEEHADYGCLIVKHGEPGLAALMLGHLQSTTRRETQICVDEVPTASSLQLVLERMCGERPLQWVRTGRTACPRLAVLGAEESARALLQKKSLRRHRAALSRIGKVEVRHERDAVAIRKHLPRFFEQHVLRWSHSAYPSLFEKQSNREFYQRLVEALCPSGHVIFTVLALDGHPIAYHFGFLSNATLVWYKPAFDVEWSAYSPGEILLGALIEYSLEYKLVALDFTRGAEGFKSRFASSVNYNCSYVRLGSYTRAILHHAKAVARHALRAISPANR